MGESATAHKLRVWAIWGGIAVLLVGALVSYLPSIHGGFLWDDADYVQNNPTLRSVPGLEAIWFHPESIPQWYPLVHTTYWIEYHLWGLNTLGYRIDNILLHVGSAILLWFLLRRLNLPGAWLAAAVWALHPINVESVAWITERKNTLSGILYLAAMLVYLGKRREAGLSGQDGPAIETTSRDAPAPKAEISESGPTEGAAPEPHPTAVVSEAETKPSPAPAFPPSPAFLELKRGNVADAIAWRNWDVTWTAWAAALVLFILSLLSKSVTCSWPAAILLILYWKRGSIRVRDCVRLIPFFIVGAGLAYFTAHLEATHVGAVGHEWEISFPHRWIIAGHALWFYAWKLFWPTNLMFIYPRWNVADMNWLHWLYPISFIGVIVALFIYRGKIGRGPLVAVLFYAGTLFPALGFINIYPMRYTFVADHYQYLAGIGLIVLLVAGMEYWTLMMDPPRSELERRIWHVIAADIPFLIPLAMLTYTQCFSYQSKATLWTTTVEKNPDSWMAHLNLGHVYVDQHNGKAAMKQYETALKLAPTIADPHYNVGYRLAVAGNYAAALDQYRKAIKLNPRFSMAYYGAGNALRETGKLDQAIQEYKKAIAIDPLYTDAMLNLGYTYELQHNLDAAVAEYQHAIAVQPMDLNARRNLASVFIRQGKIDAAIAQYQSAIAFDPSDVEATVTLLHLLAHVDRPQEFAAVYARASRYIPDLKQRLLEPTKIAH